MDFGSLGGMGGAIGSFLASPDGQDAAKKFLASPQGTDMLKSFAATPEGQKALMSVVPVILDGINLPPGVKDMILAALPR
ncbi:MAG: hypothetical protein ABSB80_06405 [Methanoregula sp.]|jgi:hypothetical protein|uniref:hypothetical protein n=1 Tax=Methanoregula sp. TaxID=2052170 RepID=UPI003D1437CB